MQSLPPYFRKMLEHRVVKTFLVGVLAVGVQTVVFESVGVFLGLTSLSTATVLGAECATITSFLLNNRISFPDKAGGSVLFRFLRFHLVVLGSIAIQWTALFIAERMTDDIFLLHIVYVASIILGFIWNYSWYKTWVWKHPTPGAEPPLDQTLPSL